MLDLLSIPCFGVAGNFTGHLEQAGEAVDFVNVKAAVGAPKALFPTYIPLNKTSEVEECTPDFLHVYPFDPEKIIYPAGEQKVQMEPECALYCDLQWQEKQLTVLKPKYFAASNDCSIRKEGAKKISLKKNWGKSSKGVSKQLLPIDDFTKNGCLNNYRIASFLLRDGKPIQYGEDSAVRDYSYIYEQLISWLIEKLNNQQNEGPAEKINDYLVENGCPSQIMISIGATRYTDFGEHNFLQNGDETVVVLYPEDKYDFAKIEKIALNHDFSNNDISMLIQKVVIKD